MMNIGIFAGSFDPIHRGHIAFSLSALEMCHLDKVYLMVERSPRGKQNVSDADEREELLKKAISSSQGLEVLSLRDNNFSVTETLPQLQQKFSGSRLTLLIGSDVACESLSHWDTLDELLPQVSFAIGIRKTHTEKQVHATMKKLEKIYGTITYKIIASPYPGVSSSKTRDTDK